MNVKNYAEAKTLLQDNKLACHSFMNVGKRCETWVRQTGHLLTSIIIECQHLCCSPRTCSHMVM